MSDTDDRDLIECFNLIYELYPDTREPTMVNAAARVPSLAESRDALRMFALVESPEMRTAIRILLRTLVPPITLSGASRPHPSAANTPT